MSVGSYTKQSAEGGMITLQPSAADLQAFKEFAAVVPKAAAAAQRRAINKTLRWLVTHIGRAVSRKERIAVAAVRQRLRAFPVTSNGSGKLWFGINPIEASRAGSFRETTTGVSVAGRRYRGAFDQKIYGGRRDIWIRVASKHFNPADYPETRLGGRGDGWLEDNNRRNRYPVAKPKISLESVRPLFEQWVRRADQRLIEVLQQELNFEIQKVLKGGARGR